MLDKSISRNSVPEQEKLYCMLCLSIFTNDKKNSNCVEVVEILSDIFKVLCKHMKWVPPLKFQYNFSTDIFPFCKGCRLLVAKIYKYDRILLDIQKQIDTLASQLSAKILESQNDIGDLSSTKGLNSSENSSGKYSKDCLSEKSGYYRNSICSRYTPYVRLVSDSALLRTSESRKTIPQVDLCYSDSINSPSSNIFEDNDEDLEDNKSIFDDGGREDTHFESIDAVETENVRNAAVTQDDFIHNVSKISQTSCISQYKDEGVQDSKDDGGQKNEVHFWDLVSEAFPKFGDRLKKVGDCQFMLDDKCHFEYSKMRLKCISCDILFRSKESLTRHLRDCPGNPSDDVKKSFKCHSYVYDRVTSGELRCRRCKYLCKSRKTMFLHMAKFHGTKNTYKAKIKPVYIEVEPNKYLCNQKYPFEFKDEKFSCGTCFSEFSDRSELLTHIEKEHIWVDLKKAINYKEISPGKFVWTDPFDKKFSFQKVGSVFKCDDCSYSTSGRKYMNEHIRSIHIEQNSAICQICGKLCPSKSAMKLHMKVHRDDRPFMCELCGVSYKRAEQLAGHRGNKHPEICGNNYECQECGRVFGTKYLLNEHETAHTDSVCDVCGKTVKLRSMYVHMKSHKEESRFECKKCFKKFKRYFCLQVHLKSHDGAKPYTCEVCGMKFSQRFSVTRHKNIAHNPNNVSKSSAQSGTMKRKADVSSDEEEDSGSDESYEKNQNEDENNEVSFSTNEGNDMLDYY